MESRLAAKPAQGHKEWCMTHMTHNEVLACMHSVHFHVRKTTKYAVS